jgi:NAD(P)-dependent dehydrogenase (short-subunit alcohol dehydrogenase family)
MPDSTILNDDFQGRWVLLSGATSGLGGAIAKTLEQHNARLLLLGRSASKLNELKAQLAHPEHEILAMTFDDPAAIEAALSPTLDKIGHIYAVCHCAGVVDTRPLKLTRTENLLQQLTINMLAGIELARLCSTKARMPAEGSLLFISSIYASVGAPGQIGYCASKGALNAAVRAMAVELAARKIRVNTLSPGFVATEMTLEKSRLAPAQLQALLDKHPLGSGTAEDVARAATFLLSPDNRWITGTDLIIDGGFTAQ